MDNSEARLRELSRKAFEGAITDEELGELAQASRAKQKKREDRIAVIAGLRETLQSQGITIAELFSATEITRAALLNGVLLGRLPATPTKLAKPTQVRRAANTPRRHQTGPVLVEVKKEGFNGYPCRYCKGQLFSPYVAKGFKRLDDGQLEANLERHYTAEGSAYFATEVGRAELALLIDYIKTRKVNPQLRGGD